MAKEEERTRPSQFRHPPCNCSKISMWRDPEANPALREERERLPSQKCRVGPFRFSGRFSGRTWEGAARGGVRDQRGPAQRHTARPKAAPLLPCSARPAGVGMRLPPAGGPLASGSCLFLLFCFFLSRKVSQSSLSPVWPSLQGASHLFSASSTHTCWGQVCVWTFIP